MYQLRTFITETQNFLITQHPQAHSKAILLSVCPNTDCILVRLECSHCPLYKLLDSHVHMTSVHLFPCTHLNITIHTVTRPPPTKPPLPTVHPTIDCRLVRCAHPTCPNPLPPLPGQCCPRCLGKQYFCLYKPAKGNAGLDYTDPFTHTCSLQYTVRIE